MAGAEALYRQVLSEVPEQPDALHLLGVARHQSGDHRAAADLIARSVKRNPKNADAHSNLGAAQSALGDQDAAERSFRTAIGLDPRHLNSHANLAALAARRGADRDAIESFTRAHRLKPDEPRFMKRLAELYLKHEQFAEAADWFGRYLSLAGDDVDALNNAGLALQRLQRVEESEARFRRAHELDPDKPEIANNLANVLRALRRFEEADAMFERVVAIDPLRWDDLSHYAGALFNAGRLEKALALYETLAMERPDDGALHRDFGIALMQAGRPEDAEQAYRRAVTLDPSMERARIEFAHCLLLSRRIDEAAEVLRAVPPDSPHYLSARLDLCFVYAGCGRHAEACEAAREVAAHPGYRPSMFAKPYAVFRLCCAFDEIEALDGSLVDAEDRDLHTWAGIFLQLLVHADSPDRIRTLADLHRRWGEKIEKDAAADALPPPDLPARRGRIRLGFVSSDLRQHSVARFLMPLFDNFDRERFEIYCYSPDEDRTDHIQNRIRGVAKEFRLIGGLGHRAAAQIIRDDEIDILFELNGFTANSGLPIMAYRPAPVQIYWLGYPFTCGLPSVDYILLDGRLAPPADADFLVEKPLPMPESWVCYDPFETASYIVDPPFDRNGFVTFGTLNNPYKFTRAAIAAWAEVMRRTPLSRYMFVHPEYRSAVVVENLMREFERNGIARERLFFINNRERAGSHFEYYNEFDATLDSFPLTGGTSTCDALWMGVPVVSRKGPAIHQRLSYSLLCSAGQEAMCVDDDAAFVETAVALVNDRERLRKARRELRGAVRASALGQAGRFGRDFCAVMAGLAERHGLRGAPASGPASETRSASTSHVPLRRLR